MFFEELHQVRYSFTNNSVLHAELFCSINMEYAFFLILRKLKFQYFFEAASVDQSELTYECNFTNSRCSFQENFIFEKMFLRLKKEKITLDFSALKSKKVLKIECYFKCTKKPKPFVCHRFRAFCISYFGSLLLYHILVHTL